MPQCHHTAVLYYILHPHTLLKNFSRQGCHHVTPATQQDVEDPVWSGALLSYESCRKPHPCWCLQRDDGQHSVSFRNSSRCLQRDTNPPPGGAVIHAVAGCTWLHAGSRTQESPCWPLEQSWTWMQGPSSSILLLLVTSFCALCFNACISDTRNTTHLRARTAVTWRGRADWLNITGSCHTNSCLTVPAGEPHLPLVYLCYKCC